jgi:hypothetical protein
MGFTKEDIHVLDAQKFGQSWRVRRAIDVLVKAINNESLTDTILVTRPRTKPTEPHTGAATRKKKSTSKPASGK